MLACTTVGSGPPLVLVNGYTASARDWDPRFVAALAQSFTVMCPDNRGMGRSAPGDLDGLSVESMATDVEGLLDGAGVERATIVGWSMGGFIAQAVAQRSPARVAALGLLGTDAGGPTAVLADRADWARLVDRSGTPREQATRLIGVLFPPALVAAVDALAGEEIAAARATLDPATARAQEQAIDGWHATEPPAPTAAVPVLAASGTEDVLIPAANLERLAARWPGCRVERFEGCAHAFMAQEPERVAALIAALRDPG